MSSKKPVVVYGASGYTGRLVCEYLREYGIPFVAAGRSGERLDSSMKSNVAGIETANYEVVEVAHNVDALTKQKKQDNSDRARDENPAGQPAETQLPSSEGSNLPSLPH